MLAFGLGATPSNAATGAKAEAECEAGGGSWDNGACRAADKVDCAQAGACGADGFKAQGWTEVTKESSGCAATEADGNAYDEAAARFTRLDRRSSSAFNLMRRYQRLSAKE